MSLWYIYDIWYITIRCTRFLVLLYSFTDFSEYIPSSPSRPSDAELVPLPPWFKGRPCWNFFSGQSINLLENQICKWNQSTWVITGLKIDPPKNPRSMEDTIFFGRGRYIHPAFLLKVRHQAKPEWDAESFAPPSTPQKKQAFSSCKWRWMLRLEKEEQVVDSQWKVHEIFSRTFSFFVNRRAELCFPAGDRLWSVPSNFRASHLDLDAASNTSWSWKNMGKGQALIYELFNC